MLSEHCLSVLLCLSVCNVGVLWPNGLTDQDETWHADRPRPRRLCVKWGPSPPPNLRKFNPTQSVSYAQLLYIVQIAEVGVAN